MRIPANLRSTDLGVRDAVLLIDTGAEVCLIKQGLLPSELFSESQRPMRLLAANNQRLPGGTREIVVSICLRGMDSETNCEMEMEIPTRLYEAGISEDILLSYAWLVTRNLDVLSAKHGLCAHSLSRKIFVPGIHGTSLPYVARICGEPLVRVSSIPKEEKRNALDLCAGTGSATDVLREHGFDVVSVDLDPRWGCMKVVDILEWVYKDEFPPGYFQIIVVAPLVLNTA